MPLICISSIVCFLGGFFLGDSEARQELHYYSSQIQGYRNTQYNTLQQ